MKVKLLGVAQNWHKELHHARGRQRKLCRPPSQPAGTEGSGKEETLEKH